MKKINIVKESSDFEKIIHNGKYIKNNEYIIYYKDNELNRYRFGLSVGKKIGNAVTRNYYKRQLRNIIDQNKKYFSNTKDYIIILRKNCLSCDYNTLLNSFIKLINKIEGEKNEKTN